MQAFEQVAHEYLTFEEGANPWCNTVLTVEYPPELLALPPGIGFSTILGVQPEELGSRLRSQYVLVDQETYTRLSRHARLDYLGPTPIGNLYRNRDSGCSISE